MGKNTSNAGKIYPPSGTLDLKDVALDRTIDIEASMRRELREETGLLAEDLIAKEAYIVTEPMARVCVVRVFDTGLPAADTIKRIQANIAADPDPELDDVIHVKRGMEMPDAIYLPYVQAIMNALA
jgi:8-oxo-dGTP pyrophosphatase MutT (NUDIX family)